MNEQQLREKFPLDPKSPKAYAPQDLRAKAMDMLIHHTSHLIIAGELPELIVNAMLQFASEVAAGVKNNCIETLWVHYKETGGYTNTASRFIQKITGEKWERDKEYDEMKQRIAELQSQVEALKQNSKARITELEDELKEIKSDLLK